VVESQVLCTPCILSLDFSKQAPREFLVGFDLRPHTASDSASVRTRSIFLPVNHFRGFLVCFILSLVGCGSTDEFLVDAFFFLVNRILLLCRFSSARWFVYGYDITLVLVLTDGAPLESTCVFVATSFPSIRPPLPNTVGLIQETCNNLPFV